MSSDLAISVRNLSKTYQVAPPQARATTLAELLGRKLRQPFARRAQPAAFQALREVSFEVRRGEVLGIIGRNGAGKSTLLKVLSQITPPTSGEVDLYGRVGSLLEVGTGFHPELTGRENIYLNGAILGMNRAEIRAAFDSIVAFAETEAFLDTPVKRYSSGMYVRLAFAVAAHLRPDILIVDEVLAVGDLAFQRKCLGKMEAVAAEEGRTVLFVSHSMNAIAQICGTALCLERGAIVRHGPKDEVIRQYLTDHGGTTGTCELPALDPAQRAQKKVFFRRVALRHGEGSSGCELDVRQPFEICLQYEVPVPLTRIELSLRILTAEGTAVFTSLRSDLSPDALLATQQGAYECRITVPGMLLMPGDYLVNVAAHAPRGELYDLHEGVLAFTVHDTGTNFSHYGSYASIGVIIQNLPWREQALAVSELS